MREKKRVHEVIDCSVYFDGDTLEEVIKSFQNTITVYKDKYFKITIEQVEDRWENRQHWEIWGWREETDEEQEKREQAERIEEDKRTEWEKEEYERLKNKFEGEK